MTSKYFSPSSFEKGVFLASFNSGAVGTLYNTQYTTNIAQYTTHDTEHQINVIIPSKQRPFHTSYQ